MDVYSGMSVGMLVVVWWSVVLFGVVCAVGVSVVFGVGIRESICVGIGIGMV